MGRIYQRANHGASQGGSVTPAAARTRSAAAVSPEERSALFAALPLRVRLVAETLYVTGTRVLEVLGVRRDQVKVNSTNYLLRQH